MKHLPAIENPSRRELFTRSRHLPFTLLFVLCLVPFLFRGRPQYQATPRHLRTRFESGSEQVKRTFP
jgi:hypothetical protein